MLSFTNTGSISDVLYSLYFCRELSRHYDSRKINISINQPILKNLLESQTIINSVTLFNPIANSIDLNRSKKFNWTGGDVRDYYYQFNSNTLPRDFFINIIKIKDPDYTYKDKILYNVNNINLQKYDKDMVFVGTKEELIKLNYKPSNFIEVDDYLTLAKYMAGAKGFLGNQNDYFALAELMKVNRILFNGKNLAPISKGEKVIIAYNPEKVFSAIEDLLKTTDNITNKEKNMEESENEHLTT